jgi:hypothetical protein
MGQNAGTLHLSLRNPEDRAEIATLPATLAELKLGKAPPANQKKEPDAKRTGPSPSSAAVIRTLHGTLQGTVELKQ